MYPVQAGASQGPFGSPRNGLSIDDKALRRARQTAFSPCGAALIAQGERRSDGQLAGEPGQGQPGALVLLTTFGFQKLAQLFHLATGLQGSVETLAG